MPSPHTHGHDVGERLFVHRHSVIHRLPAEVKTVAMVLFIFTVIMTPPNQFWAFGLFALMLVSVAAVAKIPARVILPRMLVEVLGLSLSQAGLLAGWGILIKGTLGVVSSILLAATTPARDLLMGLERLKVPELLVQIASFMLRYTHVVADEMKRMKLARESRGFTATGIRSWPIIAQSGGALFIRSYERGERVHLAMLSRGYTGRLPQLVAVTTTTTDWVTAMSLPAVGLLIALTAIWMGR